MELDKQEAKTVGKVLRYWRETKRMTAEQAEELEKSFSVRNANADAITTYALISAISCGLLAFGALVLDEKWIELLRRKWGFSETIVGIGFSLLAAMFVVLAKRRKTRFPDYQASNETYNITIILTVAIAITYWVRSLTMFKGNYALPLLFAVVAYGIIAGLLESKLIWIVMILTLAGWWGAQTHYWAGGHYRFAGMNYPLRMTLFGLLIWGGSGVIAHVPALERFRTPTYTIGLFLFLVAAWTLSIFGNYDDLDRWTTIHQGHFWYWALGFTLLLAGLIYQAFRTGNDTLRDMGMIFFLLNIYTRYFEYFWDRTNKGIFFAILALSFWFVARKAEQWRQGQIGNKKTAL